jgi:hypothetical protein
VYLGLVFIELCLVIEIIRSLLYGIHGILYNMVKKKVGRPRGGKSPSNIRKYWRDAKKREKARGTGQFKKKVSRRRKVKRK